MAVWHTVFDALKITIIRIVNPLDRLFTLKMPKENNERTCNLKRNQENALDCSVLLVV